MPFPRRLWQPAPPLRGCAGGAGGEAPRVHGGRVRSWGGGFTPPGDPSALWRPVPATGCVPRAGGTATSALGTLPASRPHGHHTPHPSVPNTALHGLKRLKSVLPLTWGQTAPLPPVLSARRGKHPVSQGESRRLGLSTASTRLPRARSTGTWGQGRARIRENQRSPYTSPLWGHLPASDTRVGEAGEEPPLGSPGEGGDEPH